MKIVFYSLILNHHQACLADELYKILGDDYAFVETAECHDQKGATEDYTNRPYLIRAWQSQDEWDKAMILAQESEVCVFGGYEALPFEKERMRLNLLSFDMGERMLKRGWLNLASPRILKMISAYHLGGWGKKPLYKLCCSSFAKEDQYKLLSFKNKCYKWGYFSHVPLNIETENKNETYPDPLTPVKIMWCARLLKLKHPELVVEMAQILKKRGYNFSVDIYGDEGNATSSEEVYPLKDLKELVENLDVSDVVTCHGSKPNNMIIEAMKSHDVFLFTSDNREGWGVVVNESMANGCAVISSDVIGSTAYLVIDGYNGFGFKNCNVNDLSEKVMWLLDNPIEREKMRQNAIKYMQETWSPRHAADSLLQLIDDLKNGRDSSILEGPCSKA